ncbi:MAG TPA: ATP-binding protein [Brevundimonas sp.]|jgi:signal transduction histidine kinase/CheY-like chemotaxis protein|uniref:ATP-binding protein n=1 Tax=Brevundimonas sp. TaxID=1871086 RepID=UPI002DECF197|nr:ATP-binding protein [Brevundimonas sp.]
MARIGDYIEAAEPVGPDTRGAEVYERFLAEPNTLVIAVVDPERRPLGLIERNAFTLTMAGAFGRELYARRPVSALMNDRPSIARAEDGAEAFFSTVDSGEAASLLGGFIAVDGHGRYVGVGAILQVLRAGSALYRRRAEEMGELARGLAAAEARARASSRAKSEFLAVMSHEIRTPLNGVLGVAALMQRLLTQEELRPHVETIVSSGQGLLRLLTDALDMSRAEAGLLALEPAPLSLSELAGDLDRLWRPRAEEKGLSLDVDAQVDVRDGMQADGVRLKQLFNNLIGNAIKFTEAGSVRVTLVAEPVGDDVRLTATVDDSGPGVPETAAATIFEPFNTGNAGRSSAGAGLGLAICRQIVDRMGGSIALATSPSGGARFVFSVSAPAVEVEAASESTMAAPTPHETIHVLVADDNATNRFLAVRLLEMFGCTADVVEDGAAALQAVQVRPYDLVLMDIKMPVMDGVEATRAVRALSGPAGLLPILALTANADDRDAETYLAAGMDGVVQKPIQPDVLLDAIRRVLTPPEQAGRAAA